MEFRIPFTFSSIEVLIKRSKPFMMRKKPKKDKLQEFLINSGQKIESRQYHGICRRSFLINLTYFSIIYTTIMAFFGGEYFYLQGLLFAVLTAGFIYFNQRNYPKVFAMNKSKNIEKNLIPALQDMLVQLNSGVPTYRILVNISNSNYGEVSEEFSTIVKKINSGIPQIQAIEESGKTTQSKYFQRVLWQISNGMRAGNDIAIVIKESIKNLNDEQAIQIQSYGSKLNPLIMFYMLIAVIIPSLGITFLIIIISMLEINKNTIQLIFAGIFVLVIVMQIMFLGLIKSRRPSLL